MVEQLGEELFFKENWAYKNKMDTDHLYPFREQPLPWLSNSFPQFLSAESLNLQYELYRKHIEELNSLAEKYTDLQSITVGDIVVRYPTKIGQIAAEVTNHPFFWKSLTPSGGGGAPGGNLYQMISSQYESWGNFKRVFSERANGMIGCGWVFLVYDPSTTFLQIISGDNAYSPIRDGYIPLLCIDVWEHAYWLDYGSNREEYVERFWDYIDWSYYENILESFVFGYNIFKTRNSQ